MGTNKKLTFFWIWIMFAAMVVGLLVWAAGPVSPARAGSDLPARETPTPTRAAEDHDDDEDDSPVGAYIELEAPGGNWAVVQWQNSAGTWEDVAGWSGALDAGGSQRWWVAAKDFGTGPFRWVVTQGQDGPVVGSSESFDLPDEANETVQVSLTF
jgi:hypothetical protein